MRLRQLLYTIAFVLFMGTNLAAQPGEVNMKIFYAGFSGGLFNDRWNAQPTENLPEGINVSSTGHTGFGTGLKGVYHFGNHWNACAGVAYRSKELEHRFDGLHFSQDFNGTGFNDSHAIYTTEATALALPLTIEFTGSKKKILPFCSFGMVPEFLLKENSHGTIYFSDGSQTEVGSYEFLKKVNLSAAAGAGIYYRFTPWILLSVGAEFQYALLGEVYGWHQYAAGLSGVFLFAL